jgi:hypothetical protein
VDSDRPPPNHKAYVCICVFREEKGVLLVSRPDGDWCFLCGGEHADEASAFRVLGIGHLLNTDNTLHQVLDLQPDEEAERSAPEAPWVRSPVPS